MHSQWHSLVVESKAKSVTFSGGGVKFQQGHTRQCSLTTSMICCKEIPKSTSRESFSSLTGREYLLYFSNMSMMSLSSLGPCADSEAENRIKTNDWQLY